MWGIFARIFVENCNNASPKHRVSQEKKLSQKESEGKEVRKA